MSSEHSVAPGEADIDDPDLSPGSPDLVVDGRVVEALAGEDDDVTRAAGCVVYRPGTDGPEVLVVHRPRYDDWDFPKGKREPGESDLECAVRETEEESGYSGEIEAELAADTYRVGGRDKVVRWFLMRCTGGSFVANEEVDEIRWLAPDDAVEVLSYGHARSLMKAIPVHAADIGSPDT